MSQNVLRNPPFIGDKVLLIKDTSTPSICALFLWLNFVRLPMKNERVIKLSRVLYMFLPSVYLIDKKFRQVKVAYARLRTKHGKFCK